MDGNNKVVIETDHEVNRLPQTLEQATVGVGGRFEEGLKGRALDESQRGGLRLRLGSPKVS
jgi:hypothetical protein